MGVRERRAGEQGGGGQGSEEEEEEEEGRQRGPTGTETLLDVSSG